MNVSTIFSNQEELKRQMMEGLVFIHVGNVPEVLLTGEPVTPYRMLEKFETLLSSCKIEGVWKLGMHNYLLSVIAKSGLNDIFRDVARINGTCFDGGRNRMTIAVFSGPNDTVKVMDLITDCDAQNNTFVRRYSDIHSMLHEWLRYKNLPTPSENDFVLFKTGKPLGIFDGYDVCVEYAIQLKTSIPVHVFVKKGDMLVVVDVLAPTNEIGACTGECENRECEDGSEEENDWYDGNSVDEECRGGDECECEDCDCEDCKSEDEELCDKCGYSHLGMCEGEHCDFCGGPCDGAHGPPRNTPGVFLRYVKTLATHTVSIAAAVCVMRYFQIFV